VRRAAASNGKLTPRPAINNTLLISSVLLRETRWFGANVVICLAWLFVVLLVQAMVLLLASPDGSIAGGWSGAPVAQVVGWATLGAWIGIFYATPVLALAAARGEDHLGPRPADLPQRRAQAGIPPRAVVGRGRDESRPGYRHGRLYVACPTRFVRGGFSNTAPGGGTAGIG
jgi:hypothetical protein